MKDRHYDCSYHEAHCEIGEPDACPPRLSRLKREREEADGQWSRLIARKDEGGWRHYLDGEPVNCGRVIEVQVTEQRHDDYGDYDVPVQRGVAVRYEAYLHGPHPTFTLHADIAGYEFISRGREWMRFRWPKR